MTGGGADGSSTVLALEMYKQGFQYSNVGYSSAISVILLLLVGVIAFVQVRMFGQEEA